MSCSGSDELVNPASPRQRCAAAALGATLVQDIVIADPHPAAPLPVIDGWAVQAELPLTPGPIRRQ
jgi:hypothetical protein